jgi:hypothetical protein
MANVKRLKRVQQPQMKLNDLMVNLNVFPTGILIAMAYSFKNTTTTIHAI